MRVRVLCHKRLGSPEDGWDASESSTWWRLRGMLGCRRSMHVFDTIIVHIHGGGFIAMSSGSHQSYTRLWAKQLRVPVFSVDYSLAPQHPYPEALNDCW